MSNALDLCLVDGEGQIVLSVPLYAQQHSELINCAETVTGCPVVMRMSNYYRDACAAGEDLDALSEELGRIWKYVQGGAYKPKNMGFLPEFLGVIFVMRSLCGEATVQRLKFEARAS